MTIYNIELSTTEPFNYTKLIKIRQDDTESQTFNVEVTENGKVLDLSSYNVLMVSRPNGFLVKEPITNPSNLTVGKFSHTISSSFWQKLGQNDAWFSFEQNGVVKDSTTNFSYVVIEGDCRNIPQGNYLWDLEELKRKLEELGLDLSNNYNDFKERLDVLLEMFKAMNTYSKEEIDRMLIKLIAGEKISATFTLDYKNKVAGSLVENPNEAKIANSSTTLQPPSSAAYSSFSQDSYNRVMELDNNIITSKSVNNQGVMCQMLISLNILEDFKRKHPSFFVNLSFSQQIDKIKSFVKRMEWETYSKGTFSAGNKSTMRIWNQSSWAVPRVNTTDKIAKLQDYTVNPVYIGADGNINILLNAEPADGNTTSTLFVDYVKLDYTVELSLRDIFTTKEELEAVKSALTTDIANLKTYVNTELTKKQDKIVVSDWKKLSFIGSSTVYYKKEGRNIRYSGIGDKSLPKASGSLLLAIPADARPSVPPTGYLTFELGNSDSTPTNVTIVRVYVDRIEMIYRNNDNGCIFDVINYTTDA